MTDPTLAELAVRVSRNEAQLARIEAQLGITPTPDPVPVPTPTPGPTPGPALPAAPTGLRATTLTDGRIQLDWDPMPGVDSWDVLDLLDTNTPVKDTVTTPRSIRSVLKTGSRRRYAVRARNSAGVSELSAAVDVPTTTPTPTPVPTPTPAPTPGEGPASVLDLIPWYLTLPTGTQGSPNTVHQPALATYSSKYFELTPEHNGVVCRVWHGGVTTSGSANPRSELRECNRDGTHASWSTTTGRHVMVVEGQVNRLTKVRPYVVIGQIHDALDDVTVFRVEGSKLWITAGDTPHGYLLDDNFTLDKRYSFGFYAQDGKVSYTYNGAVVPYTLSATTTGCYFKAGAYLQSNPTSAPGESTAEWAEVVLRSVTVTHTP